MENRKHHRAGEAMQRVTASTLGVIVMVAVLIPAPPATARSGRSAKANCDGSGCVSEASNVQDVSGGPHRRGRRTPTACTFEHLDIPDGTPVYRPDGSLIATDGTGRWYDEVCKTEGGEPRFVDPAAGDMFGPGSFAPRESSDLVYLRRRAVQPADLAMEALGYLTLPQPAIATSPPPEFDSVVNVPVYLSVDAADWQPKSVTTDVPGVSVTVTAVPQRVEWDMGTGDIVVCQGPGTPYDFSRPEGGQVADCTYTYRTTSAGRPNERFPLTATVVWRATWTVVGAPGGGDLGEVRRSSSTSLRVAQVQTVNVN
jgi:hypothetical protein